MPTIQVLDAHVADLIAAGEVVERPASVAKELMENAIDAGASAVTVEISHGGMTFLRVTDDGCGIPAAQLKTAFLRHATSKLRSQYDLEAIGTLGFRGEALAAISSVSRMEVLTRTDDAPLGASLALEGGVPGEVEEAGGPRGTTMLVRDLFFNTPARLKFMKRDAAEGAAVFAVVQRVALSHPEVAVKFIRDGKQELLTPGDGQLRSAVYAVLGRELALGLREVKAQGEGIAVSGFVSQPVCCRASRSWQFFFVNGRQVKSPLLMTALEQAYQNQRMVGKFPACVLHVETKLNAVDVNVHPAKTEVKFGSEREVFSAVYHAVLSALEQDRSRPQAEWKPKSIPGVRPADSVTPNQLRLTAQPAPAAKPAAPAQPRIWDAPAPAETLPLHDFTSERPAPQVVKPQAAPGKMQPPAAVPASPAPAVRSGETVSPPPSETEPRPAPKAEAPAAPKPEPVPQPQPEPEIVPWRVAGEVLNTYILVEQGDRVLFIDKHAAHERMNFDRMKAQGYRPMAQTLLTPAVFRLPAEEQMALLDRRDLLAEFGFDVDELGGCIAVRQAPFDVPAGEVEATLSDLAQKLLTGGADPDAARDELLHTMACKAAIKGGWKTSAPELEKIAAAVVSGQVKYCPHGRPVAIELTRAQLEKQFKRT